MNEYQEMMARHQAEVNALPLHWAFDQKQFTEMMDKLGLDTEKDIDKLTRGPAGSILLNTDRDMVVATFERHAAERKAAIEADATGDGFIYDMFLDELCNTEYGYTRDAGNAISRLGLTWREIEADPRLKHGREKAMQKFA